MNASQLSELLRSNVVELTFQRRRPNNRGSFRRMLCTMNESILNSVNGRTVLNYLPPAGFNKTYNPVQKNLALAWDILVQDFRMISAESVSIQQTYNTDEEFWNYFNANIIPMSSAEKAAYMNQ